MLFLFEALLVLSAFGVFAKVVMIIRESKRKKNPPARNRISNSRWNNRR